MSLLGAYGVMHPWMGLIYWVSILAVTLIIILWTPKR